ncbi:MAG: tetratricopeptide repeat protein [Pseudolabrys sp.]
MRLGIVCTLLLAVAVPFSPATAQNDRDRTTCYSLGTENYKDPKFYDTGLAACTRIINAKQSSTAVAAAYRARGSWKEKKDQLQDALRDYDTAIRMEPRNVEGYDYRADVHQRLGDHDKALADYNMATRIDPSYAAAYYSRGLIYEKQGKIEQAKSEYNSALAVPTVNRIAQWAQDNARARLKELSDKKN